MSSSLKAQAIVSSLCAAVLLSGCGDSYTPGELAGEYGLIAVEGQAPPYLEVATTECDRWLDSGVLLLQADGAFVLDLAIQLDCTRGGGQVEVEERSYAGTFTVDEDQLEFSSLSSIGDGEVFSGRADGSFIDVSLRPVVPTLDPFLNLRFDERRCIDICPQ